MLLSEETVRKSIIEENIIGKGGNGVVYRIPETDLVVKKLNISISKNGIKDSNDKRRYLRFKDEISIVLQQQDEIAGILPIKQCSVLDENPIKNALIYYVMPFANSIENVKYSTIQSVLECFVSLYKTLELLHQKQIGHRDIKPSNIYYYNSEYCFSDFGLVSFPDKSRVTHDEKKVGAWSTIAPEMERNPMSADPLKADIYSMAKTLWIIITGKKESFEGQYNHKEKILSINDKIENYDDSRYIHLGIINDILTRSTSNNPESRPQIQEIITLLTYLLDGNSEKICELEWGYLLDDIIGHRPTEIKWTTFDSIVSVLDRIAQTHSLNHVFLPSGGGLDLEGVKGYKNNLIELNFGYKRIVNPKGLYLRTYESAEFNHFYLETNPIEIFSDDGLCVSENRYDDQYLKVTEDIYAELWNVNYPKCKGVDTKGLEEVIVSHRGGYVFFPKMSFYNLDLDKPRYKIGSAGYYFDPYSALHEKIGSANKFASFIEEVMEIKKSGKAKHKTIMMYAESYKLQAGPENYRELKDEFEKYIDNLKFTEFRKKISEYSDSDSAFKYMISLQIGIESYLLTNELRLHKEKMSFTFEELFCKNDRNKNHIQMYEFDSFQAAYSIVNEILSAVKIDKYEEIGITKVNPIISKKRILKVANMQFTKQDIATCFEMGDDVLGGYFVLDSEFQMQIIPRDSYDEHLNNYSVELDDIRHHSNIFGKRSESRSINYINNRYISYLYKIYKHLQTSQFTISEDYEETYNESTLLKLIKDMNSKYK